MKENYENIIVERTNQVVLMIDSKSDSSVLELREGYKQKDLNWAIELEEQYIDSVIINREGLLHSLKNSAEGENAALESIQPLKTHFAHCTLKGLVILFTTHPDFPIMCISEAIGDLAKVLNDDIDILFGLIHDDNYSENYLKLTAIIKQ